jgi:Ca-activated chloride channel homolog
MNIHDSNTRKTNFVLRLLWGIAYSLAVVALVSCFTIGSVSQAQSETGSISGVVKDPSGAVVPGAAVTVKNTETNVEIKTSTTNAGRYHVAGLLPGIYYISIEKEGFVTQIFKDLRIGFGPHSVDVKLEAGKKTDVIEVNIKAENIVLDNGPSVGIVLPQDQTAQLPLANSNVLSLVKTMGGVVMTESPIFGAANLSREQISEFKVTLAPVDAERQRGNNQVQVATWRDADGRHYVRPLTMYCPPPYNTETYDRLRDNPFLEVLQSPLSTFSIDVDTASYSNMRRFLERRSLPPRDSIRIEELVNYFTYDYKGPGPKDTKPFAVNFELTEAPWKTDHLLLRVGIKGREIESGKRPPNNLVFLLDVSGSMSDSNKLPLVKQSMRMLLDNLTENDKVAIVTYRETTSVLLPSTNAYQKGRIAGAIDSLDANGTTNGAAGIQLAYQVARENFIKGGTNRVILATDGDFNTGMTNREDLTRLIEDEARTGIFFTGLGFGMGNLKDATLEMLSNKGRGNYAYIDTLEEARKVLQEQANATLVPIAKDVKIQVEFNPNVISSYRLIGYEDKLLAKEDFNNDKKMASAIGSGHTVTALYELTPADKSYQGPGVDPLKYQKSVQSAPSANSDEMLTFKIRSKEPSSEESTLSEYTLKGSPRSFYEASQDFKFASAVAAFGMMLRKSPYQGYASFESVLQWAREGKGIDKNGYREEFIRLVYRASGLSY